MISVIMPVLNEAALLGAALEAVLRQRGQHEVIVVDGGSDDATCAQAQRFPVRLLTNPRGSARGIGAQIDQGAQVARGEALLFLHADVGLPEDALVGVEAALRNADVVGGGFLPKFHGHVPALQRPLLKIIESVWRARTGRRRWFAGDTAPFVRADALRKMGGYPTTSFASDWDFARQLRAAGRLAVIPLSVQVDARRHVFNGVARTLIVTASVEAMYHAGRDRQFLRRWYRRWLPRERAAQGAQQAPRHSLGRAAKE